MKFCKRCATAKELTCFGRNRAAPDGLYSLCRECKSKANARRRERPGFKAKEAAQGRARYVANREAALQRRRARYAANPDKALAQHRAWRMRNLDHHRALCRQWAKQNPEAARVLVRRRRARLMAADGTHTVQDIAALFAQQRGRCAMCAVDLLTAGQHVDHVMPLSRGGGNGADNLQLLCPTCNRRKSNKVIPRVGDGRSAP